MSTPVARALQASTQVRGERKEERGEGRGMGDTVTSATSKALRQTVPPLSSADFGGVKWAQLTPEQREAKKVAFLLAITPPNP